MNNPIPIVFSNQQQREWLSRAWRCLIAALPVFGPWLLGGALWAALYLISESLRFPFRAAPLVFGAFLCAVIVRKQLVPLSGLLIGVCAYFAVVFFSHWDEIGFGTGFQFENMFDLALLPATERLTAWHAAAGCAGFLIFLFSQPLADRRNWRQRYTWLAGAFLTNAGELARSLRDSCERWADPGLDMGMLPGKGRLPFRYRTKNFLFSGKIGSGKTVYLKKLMASALALLYPKSDHRALIYDYKAEFYGFLLALGLKVSIRFLNPLDWRCAWWNLAAEVVDDKTAHQIAAGLVPDPAPGTGSRDNAFFLQKARAVVAALMLNFQRHSPGVWTFADVCLALRTRERYEFILRRDSDTATIVQSLEHGDTRGDVMATLDNYRWKFEVVAALWDHAMRNGNPSFTIAEWANSSSVFLMTQDRRGGEILNPVYQAILRCVTENLASQSNSDTRATWLFLDEFPTLGNIPLIDELLNTCRSRGAATAISFQDIQQVRAVYGEHRSDAILAAFDCKAIFRSSSQNAKWAQDEFLKAEYFVERKNSGFSVTRSQQGKSVTVSENISTSKEEVPLFRSEFFTYLPLPTPETGFSAAFMLDNCAYWGHEPFNKAIQSLPKEGKAEGFIPWPADCQRLQDWKPEDYKRLHIEGLLGGGSEPAAAPDGPKKTPPITPITIKRNR